MELKKSIEIPYNFLRRNTKCYNSPGSFYCSCLTGYEEFVSYEGCKDIDECALGIINTS